jgi:hypothetical protein
MPHHNAASGILRSDCVTRRTPPLHSPTNPHAGRALAADPCQPDSGILSLATLSCPAIPYIGLTQRVRSNGNTIGMVPVPPHVAGKARAFGRNCSSLESIIVVETRIPGRRRNTLSGDVGPCLTPDLDFAELRYAVPADDRHGLAFGITTSTKRVSRYISAIGEQAGVIVNEAEGKFASAHDLRRSFGTRWASRVKPPTLRLLMRHKSIDTTMDYYVDLDSDDVAAELWGSDRVGSTFGSTRPKSSVSERHPK